MQSETRTRRPFFRAVVMALAVALWACGEEGIVEGVYAPLGEVRPDADESERAAFARGRSVLLHRFTPEEGLGAQFNLTSCGGCHEKPVPGGSGGHYRDFLLVRQSLGPGDQVATGVNGVQTQFTLEAGGRVPTDEATNLSGTRNPIPFFGAGLLAEIPAEAILENADPDDLDGDGISGKANFDRGFVARFGRKAQTASIEGFVRGPFFNHMGITSNPLSDERKAELPVPSAAPSFSSSRTLPPGSGDVGVSSHFQVSAPEDPLEDDDGVADPELTEDELFDIVAFVMLTAAPEPEPLNEETRRGSELFSSVGCDGCHVRSLPGPRGRVPAYTDLLLHDMGEELADGMVMGAADGSEFRTQPLWGVVATAPYLHDGRAGTLDEAITWHGGEAAAAAAAYAALSSSDQGALLAFLGSLGGRDQVTPGLIPPSAPIRPVGEYGGPDAPLTPQEEELFLEGRGIFDRDRYATDGLGPRFNGDSCRACHFEPVPGGAGPADVDVTRQGILEGDVFTFPVGGTMAHRHQNDGTRPPTDPDSNVFETRQTPHLFGLGLIDAIPEATLLSMEDPGDVDTDGISGRAHVLTDGRVGRLGWKANVPSAREFARDAMTAEMGITLPVIPSDTFGASADADSVPDPELSASELDALSFFLERLGPPPRTRVDMAAEDAGEMLFAQIGCDSCHVPELTTEDGRPVRLYSDLLLHDIAPAGAGGIAEGDATHREFRTPPLWGLARTGPYMHDGRSFTIEEAIARHEGEAGASRLAYEGSTALERSRLLSFLASL